MNETKSDIAILQQLLDSSREVAGSHLLSIFTDEAQMSASELVAELDSVFEMHIGLVSSEGAPLVAPIDGLLFKGRIWFGFPGPSLRAILIRKDPRVSASFQRGESFAFIVHGTAVEIREDDKLYPEYFNCVKTVYTNLYGPEWIDWYYKQDNVGGWSGYINARRMFVKR